jgi:hypothetical protein
MKESTLMDREEEEALLRITAQYVTELQAGRQPKLSAYIARYPHYAHELADFVTYYHAIELQTPTEPAHPSALPEEFHIAIESTWQRISPTMTSSSKSVATLLQTAKKRRLSPARLAQRLALSTDIVTKLEQHKIVSSSIPTVLIHRLVETLQQPADAIQAYLASSDVQPAQKLRVAEPLGVYATHVSSAEQPQNFREALEESAQMTREQKAMWYEILKSEGLL